MKAESAYRPGNRSLALLIRSYRTRSAELDLLIKHLPQLAFDWYNQAKESAKDLLAAETSESSLSPTPTAYELLACCIFDLMLVTYNCEVSNYCQDNNATSLLVDSLLYQATGCEPSIPTDEDMRHDGTHNSRGVQKFVLAKKRMHHTPDYVAWTFGKEFAAISCGSAMDMAGIISVASFSILVRAHTKWALEHLFYGKQPTESERKALEERLSKINQELMDSI